MPHNLFLATKYNAHINVEISNTIGAVKYLYKYVYKGSDKATFSFEDTDNNCNDSDQQKLPKDNNEIKKLKNVSASEACWRIFEYNTNAQKPKTTRLPVHLEEQQTVYFEETQNLKEFIENRSHETQLTHYLKLNESNADVRELHYYQMPLFFRWNNKLRQWEPRKR